jgi:hypothetical protein
MEKNELLTCAQCGKIANKWCSKCKNVKYCGVDCQKLNWGFHKQNCIPIRLIATENFIALNAFSCFISMVCHHINLKRNEVLFCHAYKAEKNYNICVVVQEKPNNISYHPTYHTSFVKLYETVPEKVPHTLDNVAVVKCNFSPENCKYNYDMMACQLGFNEFMNKNGTFIVDMDFKGENLRNLEWKPY